MDELTKRRVDGTVKPAALPLIVASGLSDCITVAASRTVVSIMVRNRGRGGDG